MLEQKEEVVALLKKVMKRRGMNRKGHVDFRQLPSVSVGWLQPNDPSPVWQNAPHWEIRLRYPTDVDESPHTYSVEIDTSDFRNEDEMMNFVGSEIERQTNS